MYIFKDQSHAYKLHEADLSCITISIISPEKTKPNLVTIHLKKKSPYKSNIQVTKGMTFQNIIEFVFPISLPEGKRFVIKSSLDKDGKVFLSEQMIEEVFFESHVNLWINIEKTIINFNELFDDDNE